MCIFVESSRFENWLWTISHVIVATQEIHKGSDPVGSTLCLSDPIWLLSDSFESESDLGFAGIHRNPIKSGSDRVRFYRVPTKSGSDFDSKESDNNHIGPDWFFTENVGFRRKPMRIRSFPMGSVARIDSPGY